MKTLCQAPAKILLSGEHAVVYGSPGLSMAVNLMTLCQVSFCPQDPPFIEIELVDYQQKHAFPFPLWKKLAINIESRFHLYQQEVGSINTVLQHPIDLILVIMDHFHHAYRLKQGHWSIKIQSHPYPSRGLGSSAAVILSLLKSLVTHQSLNISNTDLLALAKTIESRQHGRSSGIDPTSILHGGLLRFQHHRPVLPLETHGFKGWLIDTGVAHTSTGQAVEAVAKKFKHNHPIWQKFTDVTNRIQTACETENGEALRKSIAENHTLLCEIGVIPQKVINFIAQLNKLPCTSAKVCGAGAVAGQAAGMVLCISPQAPQAICETYGYHFMPLEISSQGVFCHILESDL
ncbi:mevalonate kinase family protein [Thiosulfativibrio zosterae]|uniref:Mevalonate kinase n=1 Tax=Thiosulfativibrio zosterae TaxID=2675053 RepID=A0A6F8PL38_9GAMM|nr:hypothetical protein [Thiosulfativibrio zosterae]BBP42788.1 mevalonate kinase [Thiosulfativibrio zosterae]